jgi:hypothetical protein
MAKPSKRSTSKTKNEVIKTYNDIVNEILTTRYRLKLNYSKTKQTHTTR